MRNMLAFLLVFTALFCMVGDVYARGGTDCPPGSPDPDCKDGK